MAKLNDIHKVTPEHEEMVRYIMNLKRSGVNLMMCKIPAWNIDAAVICDIQKLADGGSAYVIPLAIIITQDMFDAGFILPPDMLLGASRKID